MKVTFFKKDPNNYSCNVYLIRGDRNSLDDINTLIDVGYDGFIYDELQTISTGVGKSRVEQIIITHEHFDHTAGLRCFIDIYHPVVIGFSKSLAISENAYNGKYVKAGDSFGRIIHAPFHSHDSICVLFEEEKTLFSGDTPLFINSTGGSYSAEYIKFLEQLLTCKISKIYPGHDMPILQDAHTILEKTYRNVLKSDII